MKKFDKMDWIVLLGAALLLTLIFTQKPAPPAKKPDAVAEAAKSPGEAPAAANAASDTTPAPTPTPVAPTAAEEKFVLSNPVAETTFSSIGGGIQTVKLLPAKYAGKREQILNERPIAAIGSIAQGSGEVDVKSWSKVEQTADSITFETVMGGNKFRKIWKMKSGATTKDTSEEGPGYLWDLKVQVTNQGTENLPLQSYYLYAGAAHQMGKMDGTYVSSVLHGAGKPTELKPGNFTQEKRLWVLWEIQKEQPFIDQSYEPVLWAGTNNQYYTTLITPLDKEPTQVWSKPLADEIVIDGQPINKIFSMHTGLGLGSGKVAAGTTVEKAFEVYIGPRSGTLLGKLDHERQEAMFYGLTGSLSKLFLWLLNWFNSKTASFGLAIVFLTIIVRFAIWPLSLKAYRSMRKMSQLAPMMNEIKERYKNKPQNRENAQKQQMETMGLYREYQVSPVGGCLPVLLQMPIFFGYFGMLNHGVEMRGHSFLWAKDLSLPDTVFILPIFGGIPLNPLPLVMTLTMYLQMKLMPQTPPSPGMSETMAQQMEMQKKMFKFMPLFFLLFCYGNASALALYWTVQNVVSILQTYLQKLMPEPKLEKRAVKMGPNGQAAAVPTGFFGKMLQNMQAEAERQQQQNKGNKR
jgi:YidC/Oxa1 family membrane protein insertase